MKTTVKKNLIIFHNTREFEELHHQLFKEYGQSTMMISWKTKRHHKGLAEHDKNTWEMMKSEGFHNRYHYESQVHLDFYNEAQQSWFVLKYLNN